MNHSQAMANAGHYHYSILVSFVLAYSIHLWLQVNSLVRARVGQQISGWWVIQQNQPRIASRFLISIAVFLYIWNSPSTVPAILGYMGVTLSENAVALMTLPMNIPIAIGFGYFMDSLLTFVPMLKNALPPIEFTQTETSVKETHTTETHTVVTPIAGSSLPPKDTP